jgi:sugar phosphate permease
MDAAASTHVSAVEPIERETIKRVAWRLIPLLMLGYFCAYLDRSNVGMAATTMIKDLGFSNAVFGFGGGLFFVGYFLAEIPSNLMLNKIGARRWIARIMITWGIAAALTGFVWSAASFCGIRFLLGLAEAGYYPGVVLYLTWWFPSYYRSRMIACFQSAASISLFVGPPIGGLLLRMDGFLGLHGWQWLYILEGVPAVIMSFVTWRLLTDRPNNATWLTAQQRTWLQERLNSEQTQREAIRKFSIAEAFSAPKMWLLTVAYFGNNIVGYGLVFFLPLIVKGLGVATNWIGLVSAAPYVCAFLAMNFWGWHSDLTGERKWHVAGSLLLSTFGLGICSVIGVGHPVITMGALTLAAMGQTSFPPVFWALPSALLTGTAAAAGFALMNSVANLGGWFGPWMYGLVKDATGSDNIGLLCLALAPFISAILIIMVGHDRRLERIPPRR